MNDNLHTFETATSSRKRKFAELLGLAGLLVLIVAAGQPVQGQTYTVLHNFNYATNDAIYPQAGLVRDQAGNLYGTTPNGGTSGYGTVFKIDTSGNETVLHSFSYSDGGFPYASLILDSAGNIYGTTAFGGTSGYGTVFELDPSGNEIKTYNFQYSDGAFPYSALVFDSAGDLYGTTSFGGSFGDGTVFKIDPSWNETVILNLGGNGDGVDPQAGLILDSANNLYGTTYYGGTMGYGTVFKIDSTGTETVIHNFDLNDGANPYAGVTLDKSGNLYGTTFDGGASGYGAVFKIDTLGNETVLHSFDYTDGGNIYGGVALDSAGNLYGTTFYGGDSNTGTVYKIDPSGNLTNIHTFAASGGGNPYAGVILDSSGNLYGTTAYGGSYGYGTAYEIIQTIPFSAFTANLEITSGFELKADFALGAGATPIDLTTQALTLTIGTYSVAIPAGSFQQAKQGWFEYDGTINGGSLRVRVTQTGTNTYEMMVHAQGVNLGSPTNPVTLKVAIGNNSGTTQIDAH